MARRSRDGAMIMTQRCVGAAVVAQLSSGDAGVVDARRCNGAMEMMPRSYPDAEGWVPVGRF
eukprot:9040875-Lingulodinium_polyedra.AAC.1